MSREMHHDHSHRDIQGGALRAAVFGVSDGLVSNVSLILGVAGAGSSQSFVRLAGLAGLVGGAFSMAFGEYGSMRAQTELFEHELESERREIARRPEAEQRELALIYKNRGMDADSADELSKQMMRDPKVALDVHAREELGIDPDSLGSPLQAAGSSLVAFALGASVPLLPWLVMSGGAAVATSVVLALLTAVGVGVGLSRLTHRSSLRTVIRQVWMTAIPAAITFFIGNLFGVTTT